MDFLLSLCRTFLSCFLKAAINCCFFGGTGLAVDVGKGSLQKSSSQRMHKPPQSQGINGAHHRHSCADLIDLSFDSELPTASIGNAAVSVPPPIPIRDLIIFSPGV